MEKRILLASASPRRQYFLKELQLNFEVVKAEIEEIYPKELKREEIPIFLAKLKADFFKENLKENEILITADTIVWNEGNALGKPTDYDDAVMMLQSLSAKTHEVITAVCFTSAHKQLTDFAVSRVTFKELTINEIDFYLRNFKPYDKAGSYGIQEWIGHIGITKIEGSYNNVMGLPTDLVYKILENF